MPSVAVASTKNVPRRLRWWLRWSFFHAWRLGAANIYLHYALDLWAERWR